MTKFRTCVASPVIWPAHSWVAVPAATVRVAAVVEVLFTKPPVPGSTPTLEKLPKVCVLPLRSRMLLIFLNSSKVFASSPSQTP